MPIPYLPHCPVKMQWEIKITFLFVSLFIFTEKAEKIQTTRNSQSNSEEGRGKSRKAKTSVHDEKDKKWFMDNSSIGCPHPEADSSHFGVADIWTAQPAQHFPCLTPTLFPLPSPSPLCRPFGSVNMCKALL